MCQSKDAMLKAGIDLMLRWCEANSVTPPIVTVTDAPIDFGTCAYYRDGEISISPRQCASIGHAGRAWSYPGHYVDRTPYGVVQHELGHHVDGAHGSRGGRYGTRWRTATKDKPLTGYCPDDNEWFAEMFRLFVTNPMLLSVVRPSTYQLLKSKWVSVEQRPWDVVLANAERQKELIIRRFKRA